MIADPTTALINLQPNSAVGGQLFNLSVDDSNPADNNQLVLSHFYQVIVDARNSAPNVTIGDLSGAGVQQIFVDATARPAVNPRSMSLDTSASEAPTNLNISPFFVGAPEGLAIDNTTTGVLAQYLGLESGDTLTVQAHGGNIQIANLADAAAGGIALGGELLIDATQRQPTGASGLPAENIDYGPLAPGDLSTTNAGAGVTAIAYTQGGVDPAMTVASVGSEPQDTLAISVATDVEEGAMSTALAT